MNAGKEYVINYLDREKAKFQTRLDRLAEGKETDDLDRLYDAEEHWQVMIDFTNAIKRRVAAIR